MMQYDPENTFNKVTNKITKSVAVLSDFSCPYPNCGNEKLDAFGNCTVCGYTNDLIQDSLDAIEISILRLNEYFKNGINRGYNFLDKLWSIRSMHIDFVNDYLDKLNYEAIREKEMKLFRRKYLEKSINKEETKRLESLIMTEEEINRSDMDILTKMVFDKTISKTSFSKFVLLFTEFYMEDRNIYFHSVTYGDVNSGNDAETIGYDIVFSKEKIDTIYDLEEEDSVFFLLFHEVEHVRQNYERDNGVITPNSCKYVYDYIIRCNDEEFYRNNYTLINQEIDADIKAYIAVKKLKDRFGISYPENDLKAQIKTQLSLSKIESRRMSNYIVNYHDLVLTSLIKNPEYLEQFPQLQIEFKMVDGVICRRDKEELIDEMEKYNEEKNAVLELKDLYKIESFKDLFINANTKEILARKGITYDKFYKDSNLFRVRKEIVSYYDSLNKRDSETKKNNRGYSNIAILILSIVAIVLLLFFVIVIINYR